MESRVLDMAHAGSKESPYIAIAVSRHFLPDLGPPRMAGLFFRTFCRTDYVKPGINFAKLLQPRTFSESHIVVIIDPTSSLERTGKAPARFRGGWRSKPPNYGLIMSQILKFPDSVSRRTPKVGTPKKAAAGTVTKMPSRYVPALTGDQWNEFIRLLTPDEQQAFLDDVWKLIDRYCQRIGGG
jgi:hypothetical protein